MENQNFIQTPNPVMPERVEKKPHPHCAMPHTVVFTVFIAIVVVCLSVFLAAETRTALKEYNYVGKASSIPYTISISGEGKVTAAPNIATVAVGFSNDKATVAEAQKENTTKMNDIIASIKTLGVEEKDIKTSNYNIYPKYEWLNNKNILTGYTVSQSVDVKIRDTKKISDILKIAGEKGANQIGSLNFEIDDKVALQAEARQKAIDDAKTKAQALAKQLGVKFSKIVSFSESNYQPVMYKSAYAADFGMGGGGESAPAPSIQSGENEIKANVTITYEIL
ncbi:MAG: SIMPL domain-containing protein [Parcubacteria group bacterium]